VPLHKEKLDPETRSIVQVDTMEYCFVIASPKANVSANTWQNMAALILHKSVM